jgi:hypothetical protein
MAQLRLVSRCSSPTIHRSDKRARSSFFPLGLGIGHLDHPCFALALHGPGLAPRAVLLPGPTGVVQHAPNGIGADVGQPIRCFSQCSLQGRERPGGRPILFSVGRSLKLSQDAFPLLDAIDDFRPTTVSRLKSRQTILVEPSYQLRHSIIRTATSSPRRGFVGRTTGHRQQRFGPSDVNGGLVLSTTDPFQNFSFFIGKRAQRIFPSTRHHQIPLKCDLACARHYTRPCSKWLTT